MILSLLYSAISAACALVGPLLIQRAIDVAVPEKNIGELVLLSVLMLVSIILHPVCPGAFQIHDRGGAGRSSMTSGRICLSICRSSPSSSMTTGHMGKFSPV